MHVSVTWTEWQQGLHQTHQWNKSVTHPARSVQSYEPQLLLGIPASCRLHLHPFYPRHHRTRFPSDVHGKLPHGLREDLTHSPTVPRSPPLKTKHTKQKLCIQIHKCIGRGIPTFCCNYLMCLQSVYKHSIVIYAKKTTIKALAHFWRDSFIVFISLMKLCESHQYENKLRWMGFFWHAEK